ncbi:lysoplasmalogenase TMEM86A-like [Rhynchophorus ferrugineus]|uniref:lysoplasmalogenase TMEM86A-like n=1 Tax=Rhynchophorus ferrugineus TaxID=354439 RepID=UPI003FCE5C57
MTTPDAARQVEGSVVHLIPFFISVSVYFRALQSYDTHTIPVVLLKCAPIISLMYFVVTVGYKKRFVYSRRILMGLIAGCVGDVLIIWNKLFIFAMLAFSVGHINYISAFGFQPLKLQRGLYTLMLGILATLSLYSGLTHVYLIGVPLYIFLLTLLCWRSAAKIQNNWTWIQILTCVGSFSFGISDFLIGIDKFLHPVPYAKILIMTTYYAAQLGISLSILEP